MRWELPRCIKIKSVEVPGSGCGSPRPRSCPPTRLRRPEEKAARAAEEKWREGGPVEGKRRVHLSRRQRKELRSIVRRGKSENRAAMRARILLLAWEGKTIAEIARRVGVSRKVARKWIERFRTCGMEGLRDCPRPGRPPWYTLEQRLKVIEAACQNPGDFGRAETRWSVTPLCDTLKKRRMAGGMGRSSVHRILSGGAIKPHQVKMWVNSHDPNFQKKAEEIVGLYLRPKPGHTVLCFDEKPGIQANERIHPSHPVRPGKPERVEFCYRRHGTQDLLAFFNVHTGEVLARVKARHTANEFLEMLDLAVTKYPEGPIDIVLDNLSVHSTPEVKAWLRKHRRVRFYFTPIHASWLNQVEIWFSILQRQLLRRGSFSSKEELAQRIAAYIRQWNERAKPFRWTWSGWPLAA